MIRPYFKNFTNLNDSEIKAVLDMRNAPSVREKMYNQEIISLEEHRAWVASLKNKNDCLYFLVYFGEKIIGVVDLTSIETHRCEWGYYLHENFIGSGYGIPLEYYLIEHCFGDLCFDMIYGRVLRENIKVYNDHVKYFGFVSDSSYDESKTINGKQMDFLGMTLSEKDWKKLDKKKIDIGLRVLKIEAPSPIEINGGGVFDDAEFVKYRKQLLSQSRHRK